MACVLKVMVVVVVVVEAAQVVGVLEAGRRRMILETLQKFSPPAADLDECRVRHVDGGNQPRYRP